MQREYLKQHQHATEPLKTVAEIIFCVADIGLFELNPHWGFGFPFIFSRCEL